MRVFEWRRHFWGEEDKEEELELECTEEEQKTEKALFPKTCRTRWWWRRPSRRRRRRRRRRTTTTTTTMARNQEKANVRFDDSLCVNVLFSLRLVFFPFVSPQLCRFVYILLRLCLYLKLTTNDAFRNVDANKNRACSTNGSLGSKSCSPESTALGEDRTTRSNATISLRRINSGLKF